jgi:hypothetical protein
VDLSNADPATEEGGAQAYVRALLPDGLELLFCAHHNRQHSSALTKIAVGIHDETDRLARPAGVADPSVDASDIGVEEMDGDVVLTGSVPSYPQYVQAAAVAAHAVGRHGQRRAHPRRRRGKRQKRWLRSSPVSAASGTTSRFLTAAATRDWRVIRAEIGDRVFYATPTAPVSRSFTRHGSKRLTRRTSMCGRA